MTSVALLLGDMPDDTYGCLFLTVIFTSALWAVSCVQLWFYVENYFHTDKLWLKIYVVLIWILDTVYLILSLKFLYIYFVKQFGNVDYLHNLPKDVFGTAPFSAVISAMVQAIFVMRTWSLGNRSYLLTGGLAFLVLCQFIVGMVYISKLGTLDSIEQLMAIVDYESAMNVTIFVTDTSIALVLIYLLWRRRSPFKKTENVIKRLVAYTIGTGLIVGIMMIIAFVFALVLPNSLVYLLLDYCLAKMYYNCMLASLNARSSLLKGLRATAGGMSFHLDDIASDGTGTNGQARTSRLPVAAVISNPNGERYQEGIECRVEIQINSDTESATRKDDDNKSASDFQGDKVTSVV